MRFLWLNCISNCCSSKPIMTSRFVESEAPPRLYKPGPPPLILTTQALLLQVLLLRRPLPSPSAAFCIPIASAARIALARAGLQNSARRRSCTGRGQSGFLEASWRDCSLPERLLHLHLGVNERLLCLLLGDHSWDCTANLFLHRRRSLLQARPVE